MRGDGAVLRTGRFGGLAARGFWMPDFERAHAVRLLEEVSRVGVAWGWALA